MRMVYLASGALVLLSLMTVKSTIVANFLSCQNFAWEKVRGMRPEYTKSTQILYTGVDSQGIVITCFEKCRSLNCTAFIVDLERSSCFGVEPQGNDFVPEPNVFFYHRVCLQVPESCLKTRYWQVERNLGAILLDSMARILPQTVTRAECYEACFHRKRCKTSQFRTSRDLSIGDTIGSCTLLTIERGNKPQAYRASLYRDEYLENQCHNITKTEFCSYAEYRNTLMPYSDFSIIGLSPKQCEQRCDKSEDGFVCRAYGIEYLKSKVPVCFLHSEDTMGAGVSSLVASMNFFYKEREPCIDIKVHCTNTSLTIDLRTTEPFIGKMYAIGFSETCSVQGQGQNITTLTLPLPDVDNIETTVMSCGLTPAFSIDQDNHTRSIIWSTIIVQFNPIIQRLGDQAVRVGCSPDGKDVPSPRNITVHSGFTFIDSNAGLPPVVSTVVNTSSEVPTITMNILDETLNRTNVTYIGQKLIVRIQIMPNEGPFDIKAGHMIASTLTGDSSILLLDEIGCPVTQVFPALTKDPVDNRSLIAEFSAFKFPSSQHVRFNVIVKFCLEICRPIKCSDNQISYGRRKRSSAEFQIVNANVTELYKSNNNKTDELPLQASIIVHDPRSYNQDIHPNPLKAIDNRDTFITLRPEIAESQFCINSSLALILLVLLLIIQIILLGTCALAVRTYKRMAIRTDEDRGDIWVRRLSGIGDGNFDISRKIRWADHSGSNLS